MRGGAAWRIINPCAKIPVRCRSCRKRSRSRPSSRACTKPCEPSNPWPNCLNQARHDSNRGSRTKILPLLPTLHVGCDSACRCQRRWGTAEKLGEPSCDLFEGPTRQFVGGPIAEAERLRKPLGGLVRLYRLGRVFPVQQHSCPESHRKRRNSGGREEENAPFHQFLKYLGVSWFAGCWCGREDSNLHELPH